MTDLEYEREAQSIVRKAKKAFESELLRAAGMSTLMAPRLLVAIAALHDEIPDEKVWDERMSQHFGATA